jgi:hypothetical protein
MWTTLIDRFSLVPALTLVLLVGCAPAEEAPPPIEVAPPEAQAPVEPMPITLAGCLEGANGAYALVVTEAAGEVAPGARYQVMPEAGVDLTAHVGHTVRLSGTRDAAAMTFSVTSMEHVSAECEPPTSPTS